MFVVLSTPKRVRFEGFLWWCDTMMNPIIDVIIRPYGMAKRSAFCHPFCVFVMNVDDEGFVTIYVMPSKGGGGVCDK